MKLAAKIVLAFLAGAVTLLVVDGLFSARRERQLFEQDAEADARLLGRALQTAVGDVWRRHGEREALRLIEDVDGQRPLFAIRWIWVDEPSSAEGPERLSTREADELRQGREVLVRRQDQGNRHLVTYFPIRLSGERPGALELVENLAPLEGAMRSLLLRIGLLTLALSVLAVLLAVPFGMRVIGRPLRSLVEKTRSIGRNEYSEPLRLPGRDELTELAESLNAMCNRLARSRDGLLKETEARISALEQLRHEDRLRTVGHLASGVAHELGTPLNVVQGRAGLIAQRRLSEEAVIDAAEIIKTQAESMTTIVRQLLDFARRQAPNKTDVRLDAIAREVVDLLRPMARKKQATLKVSSQADLGKILVDAAQIRQVLTNLVMNGLKAVRSEGTVGILLHRHPPDTPARVGATSGAFQCISVEDDGEGISDEDLPHLFEPFFTTKEAGEGTGLGLAIVDGIVREHGGRIEVTSAKGKGSRFAVFLPLQEGG